MPDSNEYVISVILDYKSKSISEDDFLGLMVKAPQVKYIDKDREIEYESRTPSLFNTNPKDAAGPQNSPILISDSRNNNVGGCDPLKGGTCVIR
ncbi:MAG: hypothetical protein ACRC6R_08650 [Bacteroidales bacterium]